MVDVVDAATRSRMMAGIRGRDTQPELRLRSAMHVRGFRFRLHDQRFPGRPDLVFPRYRAAVFVHGCFWHRHDGCRFATTPATRPDFWAAKFVANVERDARNEAAIAARGWRVGVVWECDIRRSVNDSADLLAHWLKGPEDGGEVTTFLTRRPAA
jgi:DNA mismatch endonuclease (patch repair protein)